MSAVQDFGAEALVVSLGVDTLDGDPSAVPGAGESCGRRLLVLPVV